MRADRELGMLRMVETFAGERIDQDGAADVLIQVRERINEIECGIPCVICKSTQPRVAVAPRTQKVLFDNER